MFRVDDVIIMRRIILTSSRAASTFNGNMAQRHLAKGSPLPPANPDVLRLYSMRFCPYAERTRLVLAHKNIPHETVDVNLKNKPDWLFERNPLGLVPIIEFKGHVICESSICDDFLEETFPAEDGSRAHALLSSCPFERAEARFFMELSERQTFLRLVRAKSSDQFHERFAAYTAYQRGLERHLQRTGSPFFGGARVGMADFHIWPFYERIPAINDLLGHDLLPVASFPRLTAWFNAMENVDAVKKCRISDEFHKRFIQSYRDGNPHYDLDLEPSAAAPGIVSNL